MSTEWRDVPGYEGMYQVSTAGAVRNSVTGSVASAINNKHRVKGCEVVYA